MMPGGSAEAYKHIQAIVEKVAAQVLPSCMLQLFQMPSAACLGCSLRCT